MRYTDFCQIVLKIQICHLVISSIIGPIFIKSAQNVAKILPLNILKLELWYSYRISECQHAEKNASSPILP